MDQNGCSRCARIGVHDGPEYASISFYIEDCLSRGQSDSTANTKKYLLTKFEIWCRPQQIYGVSEVDLAALELYRKHLYRYRKAIDGLPLQLSTQRMRLMAVTGFLERLHYHDVVNSDFYKKLALPRVPRKLPKDIPDEDEIEPILQQALIKSRVGIRNRAILEAYYATAIRRTELANLNIRDIDFKRQVVTIRKGKGSQDRKVPIGEKAIIRVKKYIKELRPAWATVKSGDALYVTQTGKRIKPNKLTEIVGECVRRSGIGKDEACHCLRHASATHMLRNGADIRYIQGFLGHQSIESTEIYTHVTINDLRRVYKATHPATES